jgi:hypothetical protein
MRLISILKHIPHVHVHILAEGVEYGAILVVRQGDSPIHFLGIKVLPW